MLLLAVISEASGRWKEGGRERAWRREVETGGETDEPAGTLRISDILRRRRAVSLVLTMKNILVGFDFYIYLW